MMNLLNRQNLKICLMTGFALYAAQKNQTL